MFKNHASLTGYVVASIVTSFLMGGLIREALIYHVLDDRVLTSSNALPYYSFVYLFTTMTMLAGWRTYFERENVSGFTHVAHLACAIVSNMFSWGLLFIEVMIFMSTRPSKFYPYGIYQEPINDIAYQSQIYLLFTLGLSVLCNVWWVYAACNTLKMDEKVAKGDSKEEKKE